MAYKGQIGPKGLQDIVGNLNKEILRIKGASMQGLIMAAIQIQRSMEATAPLTPVDLGNLRASFFIVTATGDKTPAIPSTYKERETRTKSEVRRKAKMISEKAAVVSSYQGMAGTFKTRQYLYLGYSANYAAAVHEKTNVVKWSRPGSGEQWFQKAIERNKDMILETVRKYAAIR